MSDPLWNALPATLKWVGGAFIVSGGIASFVAGLHPSKPEHAWAAQFGLSLRKYYSPKGLRYRLLGRLLAFVGFAMFGCRAYFFLP